MDDVDLTIFEEILDKLNTNKRKNNENILHFNDLIYDLMFADFYKLENDILKNYYGYEWLDGNKNDEVYIYYGVFKLKGKKYKVEYDCSNDYDFYDIEFPINYV